MRISQLPSANLPVDPNDLVLIDQQNSSSPSGYTTRKTAASNLPQASVAGLRADLASTSDMTKGISLVGGSTRTVTSITALRLLPKTGGSTQAYVAGYYTSGDGGGGQYWYDSTDTTSSDNGGSIIVAADGGRWKLSWQAIVSAKQFGAKGNGSTDDTTALQNWLDYCSSDTDGSGLAGYLPGTGNKYLITGKLRLKKQYITIFGDGRHQTTIYGPGVAAGVLVADAIAYLRPNIKGMALIGTSTTGAALDFSAVTSEVYFGRLENLYLVGGTKAGFYAPGVGVFPTGSGNLFSTLVEDVVCASFQSHAWHASLGPGMKFSRCEALTAGAGKAGFRLAGLIHMEDCNGVYPTTSPAASCDVWACFGLDSTATDGFEGDFPFTDYPQVYMKNCNVEDFGTATTNGIGILLHQAYYDFHFEGGKFDRSSQTTAYKAYVYARKGPAVSGATIRLSPSRVFLSGTDSPSLAQLYCETGAFFEDVNGVWASVGVTTYKNTADGLVYPTIKTYKVTNDVYGDTALSVPAIKPRRISAQMIRFETLASTPVGTNQTVVVTGYTKVTLAPGAAASVSNFTFDTTIGTGVDYQRNGELIIEALNGNTTLVHANGGTGQIKFLNGKNMALSTGDVVRLMWSENQTCWVEQRATATSGTLNLPILDARNSDGSALGTSPAAGKYGLTWALGGNTVLTGETANLNTKTDVVAFEIGMPPGYVAGSNLTVVVNTSVVGGTLSTRTTTVTAYAVANSGAAGANLGPAAQNTPTGIGGVDLTFTVTGASLTQSSRLMLGITQVNTETAGSNAIPSIYSVRVS